MLVICCVKTHTLIPSCLALKPKLTSWLVRPLTSLDAAQSSSMKRVLVPANKKLPNFNQSSISCCWHTITKMCGSRSRKPS